VNEENPFTLWDVVTEVLLTYSVFFFFLMLFFFSEFTHLMIHHY